MTRTEDLETQVNFLTVLSKKLQDEIDRKNTLINELNEAGYQQEVRVKKLEGMIPDPHRQHLAPGLNDQHFQKCIKRIAALLLDTITTLRICPDTQARLASHRLQNLELAVERLLSELPF